MRAVFAAHLAGAALLLAGCASTPPLAQNGDLVSAQARDEIALCAGGMSGAAEARLSAIVSSEGGDVTASTLLRLKGVFLESDEALSEEGRLALYNTYVDCIRRKGAAIVFIEDLAATREVVSLYQTFPWLPAMVEDGLTVDFESHAARRGAFAAKARALHDKLLATRAVSVETTYATLEIVTAAESAERIIAEYETLIRDRDDFAPSDAMAAIRFGTLLEQDMTILSWLNASADRYLSLVRDSELDFLDEAKAEALQDRLRRFTVASLWQSRERDLAFLMAYPTTEECTASAAEYGKLSALFIFYQCQQLEAFRQDGWDSDRASGVWFPLITNVPAEGRKSKEGGRAWD